MRKQKFTCAGSPENNMKRLSLKYMLPVLLMCLLWGAPNVTGSDKDETSKRAKSDAEKKEFPFEAQEIRISESEIYVRTSEGEEFLVGSDGEIRIPTVDHKGYILRGEEPIGEIILEDGKIKIGGTEIDLEDLEGLEALEDFPQIKIPRVRVEPRVHTGEGVFRMGSDVVVEEDESIDGDVVALWGNVTVKGAVSGDAVSIGGDVDVYSTGIVEGSAVSVGGNVIKHGAAVVEGEKVSVGFLRGHTIRFPPFLIGNFHVPAVTFFARIVKILLLVLLGVVVISIAPRHVDKVQAKIKQDFLKSGLVGILAEILILPVFILLVITIVGIPVALLIEPIFILAALILGYAGVCLFIGQKIGEHTSLKPDTRIMTVVIGILAVELIPLVARTIGIFGSAFSPLTWIIAAIGWLIGYVVITVGFGAAVLTRLGTRPKEATLVPVAASPAESGSEEHTSS
jgi:hypothetical protein